MESVQRSVALFVSSLSNGGAERIASNITLHINNPRLPILLLTDKTEYPYCGRKIILSDLYSASGLHFKRRIGKGIVYLLKAFKLKGLERSYVQWQRTSLLKRFKRENNIDVTLSILQKENLCNILSKGYSPGGTDKAVISIHNFSDVARWDELPEGVTRSRWLYKQMKRHYRKADTIIAISEPIRDRLISDFGVDESRVRIIYNPHDIGAIQNLAAGVLPDEHRSLFEGFVFITAGRFREKKGLHHMIRAFSEVKKTVPDARLILVGRGSSQDKLVALSAGLHLQESVVFIDFQNNPFSYLKNASVYVLSSLEEGFPNVIIEAMACGLPVVSADCLTGPREILAPGTSYGSAADGFSREEYGILCPVCDGVFRGADVPLTGAEKVLADAMIFLARDKEQREAYSRKGSLRAIDFDASRIMPEYLEVLESV